MSCRPTTGPGLALQQPSAVHLLVCLESSSGLPLHDGTGSRRQGRLGEGRPPGSGACGQGERDLEVHWAEVEKWTTWDHFGQKVFADSFVCLAFASSRMRSLSNSEANRRWAPKNPPLFSCRRRCGDRNSPRRRSLRCRRDLHIQTSTMWTAAFVAQSVEVISVL